MNMYLIIMEGNYVVIDADDYSCHGYYNIIFSSFPYTLQSYFSIDVQVISSSKMVCVGPFFIYQYRLLLSCLKHKSNSTIVYLRTIINGNVNIICYYSKGVLTPCLWYISHH